MHLPRKRFGQNFLIDQHIIQKILSVLMIDSENHPVYNLVEIGPGQGALTKPLVALLNQHTNLGTLTVVEIDRDLAAQLRHDYQHEDKLTIICEDALQFNFRQLYNHHKLKIIGNLPYNISTPLLFKLFGYNDCIQDMHFMLQKEVVERMVAMPNSKAYGRLSVMTQYFCDAHLLFIVPPSAFFPVPKVQSAIVRLIPCKPMLDAEVFKVFDKIVKAAFSKRRKTLSNALKELITKADLQHLEIDPQLRSENVGLNDYIRMSEYIYELQHAQNSQDTQNNV